MAVIRSRLDAAGLQDAHVEVNAGDIVITASGAADRLPDDVAVSARMFFRPVLAPGAVDSSSSGGLADFGVTPELQAQYDALNCAVGSRTATVPDPLLAVVMCAAPVDGGVAEKYLLGPAFGDGADLSAVSANAPRDGEASGWSVTLTFNGSGAAKFTNITRDLAAGRYPTNRFAIVLGDVVVSAPGVSREIPEGTAQISGFDTAEEAQNVAAQARFGALPLSFLIVERTTVPASSR